MTSTPVWVPLVVAGLGVLGAVVGTISGVLITQRRSDRREAAAWDRQQRKDREVWAREDAARTFEHRRQAYSDFYEALKAMALEAYNHGMGLRDASELVEGWQTDAFRRLQRLELYATPATALAASEAYSAVWRWGHESAYGADDDGFYGAQELVDDAEAILLQSIRRDLAIPGPSMATAQPTELTSGLG